MVPLVKLLEEDNEDLRYVTLEALGKIGSASALESGQRFPEKPQQRPALYRLRSNR